MRFCGSMQSDLGFGEDHDYKPQKFDTHQCFAGIGIIPVSTVFSGLAIVHLRWRKKLPRKDESNSFA